MSKAFVKDVEKEVRALKRNITKTEVKNLSADDFDASHVRKCIYGQIGGHCASVRAQELMNKCCKREFTNFPMITSTELKRLLQHPTDEYKGKTWEGEISRSYIYISALEGYVLCDEADIKQIINYLKGHIGKLDLVSIHF